MKNFIHAFLSLSVLLTLVFRTEQAKASAMTPPSVVSALTLTSMCSEEPSVSRRWRITNPNSFAVSFTWELYGKGITGSGVATPGKSYFETPAQTGPNTTKIYWKDGNDVTRSTVKASGGVQCDPVQNLNLTSECSDFPSVSRRWRVTNPNSFDVKFTWKRLGNPQATGSGTATPGLSYFNTSTVAGANTTIIYWENELGEKQQVTKASGGAQCLNTDPNANCLFSVDCFKQGPARWGGPVDPTRSDVNKAVLAEMSDVPGPINFFALGFGGFITLKSSCPVANGNGNDITVYETTWGNPAQYPTGERAMVYASQDGINFKPLGLAVYNASFDLSVAGLAWARYFRIQDVSNQAEPLAPQDDAFDVDGIQVLNGFLPENAATPAPATAGLVSYCGGTQGKTKNGSNIPAIRSDVTKAYGLPQGNDSFNFYSLGFGGDACFRFDNAVFDIPGPDLSITETSFNNPSCNAYKEQTEVHVSYDGVTWNNLGILCLDGLVDIGPANSGITYIKLVDVSNKADFGSGWADGFDIDAIVGLGSFGNVSPCPPVSNGRMATPSVPVFADQNAVPDEIEPLQILGNPVSDRIQLRFTMISEEAQITVTNHMGQQLIREGVTAGLWDLKEISLNSESLAPGVYFVTLDSKVAKETVKFVKK